MVMFAIVPRGRPFTWPSPEPGDLRDQGGRRGDAAIARAIIEWFIEEWGPPGYRLPTDSPLAELLEVTARYERGEEAPPFQSADEYRTWQYRILALRRLARSIRILHGPAGRLRQVHESFITRELAGIDNRAAEWTMPTGVGTVILAGRLMQASGGEMVITGAMTQGHDIRWKPETGGEALIERKDRSLDPGANETLDRRIQHIVRKVREAGPQFPQIRGTVRPQRCAGA